MQELELREIGLDRIFDSGMEFVSMLVGEKEARQFQRFNKEPEAGVAGTNRKPSPKKTGEYSEAMLADEWVNSPHCIAFNKRDEMIDGQQRIKAVIKAAQTNPDILVPFTLAFNVPDDVMEVLDTGKKRSPQDFMGMHGELYAQALATACKAVYCYYNVPFRARDTWRGIRWTNPMQRTLLAENPMLRDGIKHAAVAKNKIGHGVAAAFWYIAWKEHSTPERSEPYAPTKFLMDLGTGANIDAGNPVYKLREALTNRRYLKQKTEWMDLFAFLIKAYNATLIGEDNHLVRFMKNERFPRLLPLNQIPLTKLNDYVS